MAKGKNKNTKHLGKGIGALLSGFSQDTSAQPKGESEEIEIVDGTIVEIPLENIEVNPHQPRKIFDEQALQELSESIRLHGIIQPITVREMGDGNYQLIAGERRFRASKLAELTQIPAFVRTANDKEMQELALIENLQREDLSPMEVASTYKILMDKYDLRQEDLAKRVGKSRVSVTNILSLLTLPPDIVTALTNEEISRGHAILLARENDRPDVQLMLLNRIKDEKMSVRTLEQVLADLRSPRPNTNKPSASSGDLPLEYQKVQDNLKSFFGAKIQLKRKSNGEGQILIPFSSDKDLNRLLDLLEE